jgi:hypothetical protein
MLSMASDGHEAGEIFNLTQLTMAGQRHRPAMTDVTLVLVCGSSVVVLLDF